MSSYLTIPPRVFGEPLARRQPLAGVTVLFGIGGASTAIQAVESIRALRQQGVAVEVVLGDGAERFVGPEAVSAGAAPLKLDSINLLVLAPCTAEFLKQLVERTGGDPLLELSARTTAPETVVVPHLTRCEWEENAGAIAELRARSVIVIGPAESTLPSGALDTSGLFEPSMLSALLRAILGREVGDLRGRHLVISAGGNKESIDAVRWISNRSSGKQGHAIAEAARDRGAVVTLVTCAPETAPSGLERVVAVESHAQLRAVVESASRDADAYIAAAAVADFTPAELVSGKLHRQAGEDIAIRLVPTQDILAGLPTRPGFVKVAFAAEAEGSAEANHAKALKKLERKGAAMIVLNDVLAADAGFGKDTNRISIIEASGEVESYPAPGEPALAKYDVANLVLDHLLRLLYR